MNRAVLVSTATALLLISPVRARAVELFCQGTVHVGTTQGDYNFVLELEDATHVAKVWTTGGTATGKLDVQADGYRGIVTDKQGAQHSVVLNRYTGQLIVLPLAELQKGGTTQSEFWGTCAPAQPRF